MFYNSPAKNHVMKTRFRLLLFLVALILNPFIVICRPQDLFLNSIDQPIGNDVSLFSPDGSDDFLDDNANPTDLALSPDLDPGEVTTEPSFFDSNDLFPFEDLTSETVPVLQSSSSCQTDVGLSTLDEDFPQLQARDDGPSCASSQGQDNMNSIINLFQDPEGFLREKIPTSKPPNGQADQPGQFDVDLNSDAFRNRQSLPGLFEDDDEKCRPYVFGLSNIPVCHDFDNSAMVTYLDGSADLYQVEPCTPPHSLAFYDGAFLSRGTLTGHDSCFDPAYVWPRPNSLVL